MISRKSSKPQILVIDDDPSATELFQIFLSPREFTVLTANSGDRGIEIMQEDSPDLVLLDLLMPGIDGWQVCSKIRQFSKVPIIIISVIPSSNAITKALNLGADDYLPKPVSPTMLKASIKNLLRRARSEKDTRLQLA